MATATRCLSLLPLLVLLVILLDPRGRATRDSSGSCIAVRAARIHWGALRVIHLGRVLPFGLRVSTWAH